MLSRKVLRASAVLSAGRLLVRGLDLIVVLVIARFLTPADFGLVTLATATLMVLRAVTELPVADALIRSDELRQEDIDTAFTLSVLRGVLVALLLWASAWPLAAIYEDDRLVSLMLALSLAPLVHGFRNPQIVRFSRELDYAPDTIITTAAKAVAFVAAIAFAYFTRSYWALVVVLVLPSFVSTPLSYAIAPHRLRFRLTGAGAILGFAGRVTVFRFLGTASNEGSRFFIGGILGTAPLGIFAMGRSIGTTVSWAIGTPLVSAMFTGFSKLQHDREAMRRAYLRGQAMVVALIMPLGFGMAVLAEPIVALVLGPTWAPTAPVVQLLAPMGALATMTMPVHGLILALGKPQQLVNRELVVFLVSIPAVVAGAYWFGLMGAVYGEVAASLLQILLSLAIVQRELGASIARQLLNSWRSFAGAACMVAVVLLLRASGTDHMDKGTQLAHLALQVTAGGLTYVTVHALLWLVAGKPQGPESFSFSLMAELFQRITRSGSPKGSSA